MIEKDKALEALENLNVLKREAMDVQHTRFAVLFEYMKELYVLSASARKFQLSQIKLRKPDFEEELLPSIEKEERFSHPDELKKRHLTDFKRRVLAERARKIRMATGEEIKRDRPKASISLIQLLQDQLNEMRSEIDHFNGANVNEDQKNEEDYLDMTRQGIKKNIKTQNSEDDDGNGEDVPFYLRYSYSTSNQLLRKIVHLDSSFKSHLNTVKAQHLIRNSLHSIAKRLIICDFFFFLEQAKRKEAAANNKKHNNDRDDESKGQKSQSRLDELLGSRSTIGIICENLSVG